MAKNYYIILGISKDATQNEIKAAYRQLVKELHPDHYGENTKPFIEVQEAYCILSDPARRRAYDLLAQKERKKAVPQIQPEPLWTKNHVDPIIPTKKESPMHDGPIRRSLKLFGSFGPSFDEIFDHLWNNFSNMTRPKAEKTEGLDVEITLSTEDARYGGHVKVIVPARVICPACHGDGAVGFYECWECAGEGAIKGLN